MSQYLRPFIEALSLTTQPVSIAAVASFSVGQVSVATTSTLIRAANTTRKFLEITNSSPIRDVYIGNTGVTITTGHIVPPGSSFIIDNAVCTAAFYGVAQGAAATVTYIEW